jgi:glutathione S-transferase
MVYQLHGERGSGAGIVEVALVALGVKYEFREVSLGAGAQRSEAYAQLNPQRKLPALVTPEGETLTESAAILLILDERHPSAGLFPEPRSAERAQALRWLLFLATELYPIVEISDYPERFAPPGSNPEPVREQARGIWRQRWLLLESQIAGQPWLLPSGFCFTDVYLAALSRWAHQDHWRPAHIPRVEALARAVAERPVIGPVWLRHFAQDAS